MPSFGLRNQVNHAQPFVAFFSVIVVFFCSVCSYCAMPFHLLLKLHMLMCRVWEYVYRLVLLYNPVILTKLITILVLLCNTIIGYFMRGLG